MPRPEKVATVEEIRSKLESSRAAVLTEYRGLKVGELAALRSALRAADADYKIFKNTLARRAAEEAGFSDLVSLFRGPTAITFVRGDAVVVAKALRDYARTNPGLVLKGGVLGDRIIRSDDVVALADIQPREVLLARIAGGFQAPLTKAAGLFQAFTRNMAYGLKALIDKRVAAEPPTEAPAAVEVIDEAPPTAEAPEPPVAEIPEPPAVVEAAEPPVAEIPEPPAQTATAEAPEAEGHDIEPPAAETATAEEIEAAPPEAAPAAPVPVATAPEAEAVEPPPAGVDDQPQA